MLICVPEGLVYIWDRDAGRVFHQIRVDDAGSELECVAWNPGSEAPMLAIGTHDGQVTIWTVPATELTTNPPNPTGSMISQDTTAADDRTVDGNVKRVMDMDGNCTFTSEPLSRLTTANPSVATIRTSSVDSVGSGMTSQRYAPHILSK